MRAEFEQAQWGWKVAFEDDGATGYAYLLVGGQIAGDVWLYNRGEAPQAPEWRQTPRPRMPFRNSAAYLDPAVPQAGPVERAEEVAVRWVELDDGKRAEILIGGRLIAMLFPGSKPGFSKVVRRDGPLARRWDAGP